MLINFRNALMSGKRTPTAKDYVQTGLVAMLDCIENGGYGVHVDGQIPIDLAGGAAVTKTGSVSIAADSLTLASGACLSLSVAGIGNSIDASNFTLQICGKFGNNGSNVALIGIGNRGVWIWRGTNYTIAEATIKTTGYNNVSVVRYVNLDRFSFSLTMGQSPMFSFSDGSSVAARYGTLTNVGTDVVEIGRMGTFSGGIDREYCAVRIYNRNLTASEIAANYAIDKARFNLP